MKIGNPDDVEGVKKNSEKKEDEGEVSDTEAEITLYKNGFTVDGGELRDYDTEENKEFMNDVNKGYVPKELRKIHNKPIGISI